MSSGPLHRLLIGFEGPITARRAGQAIAVVTMLVTIASGVVIWLVDRNDFPNVWLGLWWAVQTVTTVGYGDVVPTHWVGRLIGAVVMLSGIGFVTVVTAAITALFVESARGRREEARGGSLAARLDAIAERLDRIEAAIEDGRRGREGAPP
jgi:voltage-gated potassium channel